MSHCDRVVSRTLSQARTKSTNEIRDTRSPTDLVAASLNLSVRTMVKTACDRLLPSFIEVEAVFLRLDPAALQCDDVIESMVQLE